MSVISSCIIFESVYSLLLRYLDYSRDLLFSPSLYVCESLCLLARGLKPLVLVLLLSNEEDFGKIFIAASLQLSNVEFS